MRTLPASWAMATAIACLVVWVSACAPEPPLLEDAQPLAELGLEEHRVPAAPLRTEIGPRDSGPDRTAPEPDLLPLRVGGEALGMHLCAQLLDERLGDLLPDRVVVPELRTHEECVQGLARGELEAALCTRPLRHRDRRLGLVEHPLGELAFAALVPKSSRVWDLRRDQLAEIVAGHFTQWDQVGGPEAAIECLVLEDEDPLWECFVDLLFPGKRRAASLQRFPNEDVIQVVLKRKPFGLALVPLGAMTLGADLRALSINGVYPSDHSVRSRKYPLRVRCSLVVRRNASVPVLRFVSYVTGPEGRKHVTPTMTPVQ